MYSKGVLASFLYLPIKEIEDIKSLMSELTITPKFGGEPVQIYNMAHAGWFGVPLYHSVGEIKSLEDKRVESPISLSFVGEMRPGQKEVEEKFRRYVTHGTTGFLLEAKPGSGKCHGRGTLILMFDGCLKRVETVRPGDLLMGPDSRPRLVESTTIGRGRLFKITPINGVPFTCNEDHILPLYISSGVNGTQKSRLAEISVKEWILQSGNFKAHSKLRKVAVEFPKQYVSYDPYFIGLYLGDGTAKEAPCITVGDDDKSVLSPYLKRWAKKHRVWIREVRGRGCTMFHFSGNSIDKKNPVRDLMVLLSTSGEKRIPTEYLVNSRRVRLEVLAGLMDADGFYHNKCFDLTMKGKLAGDIVWLARSLGLRVKATRCQKSCGKYTGTYTRISISGLTHSIPCKLKRKRPLLRKQKKNPMVCGFKVEEIRPGKYYGFTLSGDGLYLLSDFTVTHNTTVAIRMLSILGQRTLVVVPRSNLVKQWRERLLQFSNLKPDEIGWVEGGKGEWRDKKVVVGLVHSLVLDRYGADFRKAFGCIVFDEVDRSVPPATFSTVAALYPARYRIAMSATLKRQDGMEVVFYKHVGQVLLNGMDEGRMKPKILMHFYSQTSGYVHAGSNRMNRRGMLISRLASNPSRTHVIGRYAELIWKSGRRCLVLSDRKKQLVAIRQWLVCNGIPDKEIGYYVRNLFGNKPISEAERRRVASACKIILGTFGMIALGTDIPDLAGLIYATPQSETEQSKGRIERALAKKKEPVIVDIVDTYYNDCIRWAQKRQRHYRSQGLEVKTVAKNID